jgi:hypothetical protein
MRVWGRNIAGVVDGGKGVRGACAQGATEGV